MLNGLAKVLVKKPKTVLLLYTLLTLIVGYQATNLYMVSDLSVYLPEDQPAIKLMKIIDREWNIGPILIIYVEAENVLDIDVLKDMDTVTRQVDPYRHDEGRLDGVISSNSIVSLIKLENSLPPPIGKGRYELPESEYLIKKYVAQIGEGRKSLLTDDLRSAAIVFTLRKGCDGNDILSRANRAINNVTTKMHLVGSLPMDKEIRKLSLKYLAIIFPIASFLTAIVIILFHRTLKGLIIAFFPPIYSIILTFGFLGLFAPELTLLSVAIVALLIGLGVDYSIHLMNRFAEEENKDIVSRMEKTLRTTGKAILLSAVTTMVGFSSIMISSLPPLVNFGLGCTIGIFLCLISTIILTPCLVVTLRFEERGKLGAWKGLAKFASSYSSRVLILACILVALSVLVIPKVETNVNYMEMVPKGIPVIEKTKEFAEKFGFTGNINVLLVEGDLTDPSVLKGIYRVEERLREKGLVVYSIVDAIKKMNLGTIPDNRYLIKSIYSTILKYNSMFVDRNFSKLLISINIPAGLSMDEQRELVNTINGIVENSHIPGCKIYRLTGSTAITVAINDMLFDQQMRSLFVSLLFVFATLIIVFGSSLYATITMIPVVFVLLLEPGILVFLDIPLSVVTIVIASIVVGTGVDYAIHITQRVREGLKQGLDRLTAVREAIEKTGLSITEASLTTVAGLSAVYVVNILALHQFVTVIIAMILLSLLGSVFLLPSIYRK